jgi:Na+-driven multidrug efflux pump
MIEQTLKYSLGLVDSMMVAGVGEAAALLVGGSAVVSQYIGAEEPLKSNHYL